MKIIKNQQGSAHLAAVVVIAILVLGVLGFVFWQNFIKADEPVKDAVKDEPAQSTKLVSATFNPAFGVSTSFEYPSDWKLDRELEGPVPIDEMGSKPTNEVLKITSPSGDYSVSYRIDSMGGVGGTCDPEDTPYEVAKLEYDQLNDFRDVSFTQLAVKDNRASTYTYDIGLGRTSFAQSVTAGGPTCTSSVGLAHVLGLEKGRMLRATANIKSLDDASGVSKNLADLKMIEDSTSGKEYTQMKAILLSTKASLAKE